MSDHNALVNQLHHIDRELEGYSRPISEQFPQLNDEINELGIAEDRDARKFETSRRFAWRKRGCWN